MKFNEVLFQLMKMQVYWMHIVVYYYSFAIYWHFKCFIFPSRYFITFFWSRISWKGSWYCYNIHYNLIIIYIIILNLFTSEHEIEKKSLNSFLASHLNPNTWSHSILRQNNSHGNAARDRDALIIHWHIHDLLTVSGTT